MISLACVEVLTAFPLLPWDLCYLSVCYLFMALWLGWNLADQRNSRAWKQMKVARPASLSPSSVARRCLRLVLRLDGGCAHGGIPRPRPLRHALGPQPRVREDSDLAGREPDGVQGVERLGEEQDPPADREELLGQRPPR